MGRTLDEIVDVVKKHSKTLGLPSEKVLKESHLAIGTAILDDLYAGDIGALRSHDRKDVSLRDISKRTKVPLARLSRCVAAVWAYKNIDPKYQNRPTVSQLVLIGKPDTGLDAVGIKDVTDSIYKKTDTPKWVNFTAAIEAKAKGGGIWDAFKDSDKFPPPVPMVAPVPHVVTNTVADYDPDDILIRTVALPAGMWDLEAFKSLIYADDPEIINSLSALQDTELKAMRKRLMEIVEIIKVISTTPRRGDSVKVCKVHKDGRHVLESSGEDDLLICKCGYRGTV